MIDRSIDAFKSVAARFIREEEGATLVEYVLLVALIGIAAVVAVTALGNHARNSLNASGNTIG